MWTSTCEKKNNKTQDQTTSQNHRISTLSFMLNKKVLWWKMNGKYDWNISKPYAWQGHKCKLNVWNATTKNLGLKERENIIQTLKKLEWQCNHTFNDCLIM